MNTTARFEVPVAPTVVKKPRTLIRNEAKLVTAGSAAVQIFGRDPGPFTIAWRESAGGQRHRAMRTKFKDAKKFAEKKATEIANGQTAMSQFTEADRASYLRATELIAPFGKTLELAAAEYTDLLRALNGTPPAEAIKFFLDNRPANIVQKNIPEIVEDLIGDLLRSGAGLKWRTSLGSMLRRAAANWTGPMHTLNSADVNAWLRTMTDKKGKPVGARTRANHLRALQQLETYAKGNGYALKSREEITSIKAPELPQAVVKTMLPDDLVKLLSKARPSLIPFIACAAFAGIRHEEMVPTGGGPRLDWRTVNLERRNIYVPKDVGKEGDRNVPISENLAAWLLPHRHTSGPVCALVNAACPLGIAKAKAGIPSGRDESRNTLRKSFITYRLATIHDISRVAEEAGNSPAVIKSNYKGAFAMPGDLAKQWFGIIPQETGDLPLFVWAEKES